MNKTVDIDLRRKPEQERSKDTVNTVLSAAKTLFGEYGIDVVSMTQIAKEAGMSKPALYRYFPNKQSILRELAESDFAENEQLIVNVAMTEYPSIKDQLIDGVSQYCQLHIDAPYRNKLRAAIHADPVLAELDMQDSRKNAAFFSKLILAKDPDQSKQQADIRSLLLSELLESLVRLVTRVPEDEGIQLIEEFVEMFVGELE